MKKLERFAVIDPRSDQPEPHPSGAFVKHDDAVQAIADRQAVLDARTGERDRLLTCVEVADRMRAFLADESRAVALLRNAIADANAVHISGSLLARAIMSKLTDADEPAIIAKLYDDTRRATLTPLLFTNDQLRAAIASDPDDEPSAGNIEDGK